MHLPKLTIVRSFKTRVAGSRNSCVITLTFISSVFQQKYGIRGWFCWFSRYKMVCVRSVRLLLILASFFYNCNDFLFFAFSHRVKEEECLSRHVHTANSLRFYKFYGKIPAMRTLHAYYGIIKNNKIECVRFFVRHVWQQPGCRTRNLEKWIALSLLGLISQTSSTRWIA